MNHFRVFIEVSLLREALGATATNVGLLPSMGPQVVEVLAHGEHFEAAVAVLALEQLEEARLGVRPQKIIYLEVPRLWHMHLRGHFLADVLVQLEEHLRI